MLPFRRNLYFIHSQRRFKQSQNKSKLFFQLKIIKNVDNISKKVKIGWINAKVIHRNRNGYTLFVDKYRLCFQYIEFFIHFILYFAYL